MTRVTMQVDVASSVDAVFGFVADYRNALSYMEHFQSFRPLTARTYGLGSMVRASGRLHGIPISSDLQIVSFEPNRRLVSVSRRGLYSSSEWLFEAIAGGTRVTFSAEYALPKLPIAGRFIARMLEHDIRASTRRTLENLKRAIEQGPEREVRGA